MLRAIEGTYRQGKVELDESPSVADGTKVIVTFLPPSELRGANRPITFGCLRVEGGRESTMEDFEEAKQALHQHLKDEDVR